MISNVQRQSPYCLRHRKILKEVPKKVQQHDLFIENHNNDSSAYENQEDAPFYGFEPFDVRNFTPSIAYKLLQHQNSY